MGSEERRKPRLGDLVRVVAGPRGGQLGMVVGKVEATPILGPIVVLIGRQKLLLPPHELTLVRGVDDDL